MTNEEAIKVLQEHNQHWQRLLKEHLCDKTEGEEFTQALTIAIKAIEAVDYDCANCKWYLEANCDNDCEHCEWTECPKEGET